jgi:glycosyltransferase involved in cell wall biosynthesis
MTDTRRITLVADELRGIQGGGLGTVFTFLAMALARLGHDVELLYFGAPRPLEPAWAARYERTGVTVRQLPPDERRVEPPHFGRLLQIDESLRETRPDVVIAQDLAGAAYVALRRRQLGLGLDDTLFVVRCSGTRRWITDAARKVRVHPGAVAVTVMEQAALELADVVVAESRYMVDWMKAQGWQLPETHVIPSVIETAIAGERSADDRIDRIVFFGRLEERKGIRPFVAALNELDADLLAGRTLEFLGASTPAWPATRIRALLAPGVAHALAEVVFTEGLERDDALARIALPGTLAVMPSLEDNSPSTVYECLQLRVPFIASAVGGTAELVAAEDRERVLFEPTAAGIAAALRRALDAPPRAVRAGFDDAESLNAWAELVARSPAAAPQSGPTEQPHVEVLTYGRYDAHRSTQADWVVLLGDGDVPGPDLVETLVRAQAASGADVVTCGIHHNASVTLFLGEPHGLEVLSNAYGTTALIRRELLPDRAPAGDDPAWSLLARLSTEGARIVSVPLALVERASPPGDILRNPTEALLVAKELERGVPPTLGGLARLAAGLAAPSGCGDHHTPRTAMRRAAARLHASVSRRRARR